MLIADKTVTLYHRRYDPKSREDAWERTVYTGASWYGAQAARSGNGGLQSDDTYTVRIATDAGIEAGPGDIVVLGEVADTVTGAAELTRKYHGRCFAVSLVRDNRRGVRRLWHWRLEGK